METMKGKNHRPSAFVQSEFKNQIVRLHRRGFFYLGSGLIQFVIQAWFSTKMTCSQRSINSGSVRTPSPELDLQEVKLLCGSQELDDLMVVARGGNVGGEGCCHRCDRGHPDG
jgi:hypothetical protein